MARLAGICAKPNAPDKLSPAAIKEKWNGWRGHGND
jgi:hypothetical protein